MYGVFLTLLGPVLVLWIGALVLHLVDRFLEPRDKGGAEAFVLALGTLSLLISGGQANVPVAFGHSLPAAGWMGMPPFLIAGRTTWILGLTIVGASWMGSLASLGQPTVGRSGRLAALGAALLFLFAGDWATLILAWVLVDLALLCSMSSGGRGDGVAHESLGWTGALSLGGAAALGVALLLGQQAEGSAWGISSGVDMAVSHALLQGAVSWSSILVAVLGVLAILLRWMPFPLPTWQAAVERDSSREGRPVVRVMVAAIPCLLGLHLWTRLAQSGGIALGGRWLVLFLICAGIGLLVSGIKAWTTEDPDQVVTCVNGFAAAVLLLGAGLALRTDWMLPIGMNVVLSASTFYVSWTQGQYLRVSNVRSYWRIVPFLVALLSLAGFPLTIGFAARAGLYKTMFADGKWLALILLMAGEALFIGALLRIIFDIERAGQEQQAPAEESGQSDAGSAELAPPPTERAGQIQWMREIQYGAGAALALAIVALGIAPGLLMIPGFGFWLRLPTVPIFAALLLPIVGAVALYRAQTGESQTQAFPAALTRWGPLARRLLSLDWAYRLVERVLQGIGSVIWATTRVVEGAGYMAWVLLVCLVVLLFVLMR